MNQADVVNHWDLPVLGKPRQVTARVLSVVDRGDPTDPAVEALLLVRREPVVVFDFYRYRHDRADAVRRYA